MSKILVIRPPYAYADYSFGVIPLGFYSTFLTRYPPLVLMYLAELLRRAGHRVVLMDGEAEELENPSIIKRVGPFKPDLILGNVNIYNPIRNFKDLIELKANFGARLIVRGHFPALFPAQSMARPLVDVAMTGKGFTNIVELAAALEHQTDLRRIPGIAFRDNGELINTGPEEMIKDMDQLPFPARDLVDNRFYATNLTYRLPMTTMFGSLGCPYRCAYCQDSVLPYRRRSANGVYLEMLECAQKHGIREIAFLDPTFTIGREWTLELSQKLIDGNSDLTFTMRTRPDLLDFEMLHSLKRAGCVRISLGIESGDPEILQGLSRDIDLQHIQRAVEMIRDAGIMVFGYFMLGNKNESHRSLQNTMKLVRKLPLHFAQFLQVIPLPHTSISEDYQKKFGRDLWMEINEGRFPTADEFRAQDTNLSLSELRTWSTKFYLAFYLSPRRWWDIARLKYTPGYLRRQFEISFLLLRQFLLRSIRRNHPAYRLDSFQHAINGGQAGQTIEAGSR